jgi:hypothetical protein
VTYDPALLDELARVFAEAVVRDFFEGENAAIAPTKENDSGVKDERDQSNAAPDRPQN